MKKRLEIMYHSQQLSHIEKVSVGDWIDLRTSATVNLTKGEYMCIPLGISVKLPKGYEAIIAPRSSTFKNFGVIMVNGIGIIDETFCGNNDIWGFPALATRDVRIAKDTRICQFRIIKHQPKLDIVTVNRLDGENRGGFGSTGIN